MFEKETITDHAEERTKNRSLLNARNEVNIYELLDLFDRNICKIILNWDEKNLTKIIEMFALISWSTFPD